jgi:GMP synthase (glutamine-hydrolysing)
VLVALSGGIDSATTAALLHRAVGKQLLAIFVDHGLLRKGEVADVVQIFQEQLEIDLVVVQAADEFLGALKGIREPESKRRIIGEKFVRIFEREARKTGEVTFLAQGTIYPDVIESASKDRPESETIKTHHNVGGLPSEMDFEIVEPLRFLFKDEVRAVAAELEIPESIIWRQPFPGPGLAIRCIGEVTRRRLAKLREADAIFRDELARVDMLRGETQQAFAILLPVRSVGVMGDGRTYQEVVALRAVQTDDFMTADWARLPSDLLSAVSRRIVNEVPGVNRVVYDITSKPPATIEWE